MSLIETNLKNLLPVEQVLTTDEERAAATVALVKARLSHLFAGMRSVYFSTKMLIERNSYKLTPEQVQAALGEDYATLQAYGELTKQLLNTVVPGTVPDAPAPVTGGTPAPQATFPATGQ